MLIRNGKIAHIGKQAKDGFGIVIHLHPSANAGMKDKYTLQVSGFATDEFNHKMKYAFMNDDPEGVLASVYDNDLSHPILIPEHIGFRHLRTYDHLNWLEREQSQQNNSIQDLEYLLP